MFLVTAYSHVRMQWHVGAAEDQVQAFTINAQDSRFGDEGRSLRALTFVVHYYPSGMRQQRGSALDTIVELNRRLCIDQILEDLRKKTGKDFGQSPEEWLDAMESLK
jgi:hypothetical protein